MHTRYARPLPPTLLALLAVVACNDGASTSSEVGADAGDATDVAGAPDVADTADDTDVAPPPATLPLEATATCTPTAAACADLPVDDTLRAGFRKDHYFPDEVYDEYTDYPVDGGRFHVAGIASASGPVTDVRINDVSVHDLLAPPDPRIEWYHVWPDPAVEGEPLWVAFHSRDPAWDSAEEGRITVETDAGTALDGAFPVETTPAPLTYVTVDDAREHLLVHVRNEGDAPRTVTGLLVDGRDVLAGGVACLPDDVLAPGEAALWTVPLCEQATPGDAWTVVVRYADAPDAVGVGRVLRPHFPIEAWPSSGDCAAPGADEDAWQAHVEAGFDTMYLYWGASSKCDYRTPDLVHDVFPEIGDVYALVGDDFLHHPTPEAAIRDTSAVAGFLTGDESDGEIYEEDGSPKPENKASDARRLWSMYPEVTVYNGAMTNGNVGTFAGMTDVQGIDVYIAACAPHITKYAAGRPLYAPHDYLRNARNNHMPWPTWLYAQGLHGGWNVGEDDEEMYVQPDYTEVLVQAFMVMTAGGKGLMWFQTSQEEAAALPESWEAISRANHYFRAVRRHLRAGDPTGAADAGPDVLVEAVRAPEAIVVPVVNLAVEQHVDDLVCIDSLLYGDGPPHWVLGEQDADVTVEVPEDFTAAEVFEVTLDGGAIDVAPEVDAEGRRLVLPDVGLSNDVPVRLFVIAAGDGVREDVVGRLRALR
ncbi:MAG: hypothetical protein ACQEXJ_19780 [Myxococcota bacterium]